MPLLVGGTPILERVTNLTTFLNNHQHFKRSASDFRQSSIKKFGGTDRVLYVIQREYATVGVNDETISFLGSEDATTCHIVVLRHTGSGTVSLAHIDGRGVKKGLIDMLESVLQMSDGTQGRIELHCFGGFLDDRGTSARLTLEVLTTFQELPKTVHLVTACVTDLNDSFDGRFHVPIVYGVGVDIRSGDIFRATFEDKGPDQPLRHARIFTGEAKMLQIYDSKDKKLKIGPFSFKCLPYADHLIRAPSEWILQNLSTSPHCEPSDFVDSVRATLKQMIDHPQPLKTVFPGGKGREYRLTDNGKWTLIPSL